MKEYLVSFWFDSRLGEITFEAEKIDRKELENIKTILRDKVKAKNPEIIILNVVCLSNL